MNSLLLFKIVFLKNYYINFLKPWIIIKKIRIIYIYHNLKGGDFVKRKIKTIAVLLMSIIIISFVAAGCGAKKADISSESKQLVWIFQKEIVG